MVSYPVLVKKAKELHAHLKEKEFRSRYENSPSGLMHDLGVRMSRKSRGKAGTSVLQAFPFYPLVPQTQEIYNEILESHSKHPLYTGTLAYHNIAPYLRVLEARGLIKIKQMPVCRRSVIVVTEVFDGRKWKKALLPGGARVAR